ncbi:MAG: hypothetical protein L6R42_000464 [Xanthoria sp. 1 TBL-2021]|nr:MAG: hypothetical protein L6R42_000464 [Xanthoria sp. 1 TBL-2021]
MPPSETLPVASPSNPPNRWNADSKAVGAMDTANSATEVVAQMMRRPHEGIDYSYLIDRVPAIVESLSMRVDAHDNFPIPCVYRTCWNQSTLLAVEEFVGVTQDEGVGGGMEGMAAGRQKRLDVNQLKKEFSQGWTVGGGFFCWLFVGDRREKGKE